MQVFKKGKHWSRKVKCTGNNNGGGGCGAILLITEKDIYEIIDCSRCNNDCHNCRGLTVFCCPKCRVETNIRVSRNVVPRGKRPPVEKIKHTSFCELSK